MFKIIKSEKCRKASKISTYLDDIHCQEFDKVYKAFGTLSMIDFSFFTQLVSESMIVKRFLKGGRYV